MSRFVKEGGLPSMLLVEGSEDAEVVGAIMKSHEIQPAFDVSVVVGISQLKQAFKIRLKNTNVLRKLWVIVDADSDCHAVWQMLRDCLISHGGYDVDAFTPLPSGGAVFTPSDSEAITVGIWIMPDNSQAGMVESFLALLAKDDDTLIREAHATVERLDAERDMHKNMFKHVHKPKAVIHTWLAWQNPPGRSMGTAILQKRIEYSKPLLGSFMRWLLQLQAIEPSAGCGDS